MSTATYQLERQLVANCKTTTHNFRTTTCSRLGLVLASLAGSRARLQARKLQALARPISLPGRYQLDRARSSSLPAGPAGSSTRTSCSPAGYSRYDRSRAQVQPGSLQGYSRRQPGSCPGTALYAWVISQIRILFCSYLLFFLVSPGWGQVSVVVR